MALTTVAAALGALRLSGTTRTTKAGKRCSPFARWTMPQHLLDKRTAIMANVHVAPRIKCDNCGLEVEKQSRVITNGEPSAYSEPNGWGSAFVGGLYAADEVKFSDLCPTCVTDATDALRQHFQQ